MCLVTTIRCKCKNIIALSRLGLDRIYHVKNKQNLVDCDRFTATAFDGSETDDVQIN